MLKLKETTPRLTPQSAAVPPPSASPSSDDAGTAESGSVREYKLLATVEPGDRNNVRDGGEPAVGSVTEPSPVSASDKEALSESLLAAPGTSAAEALFEEPLPPSAVPEVNKIVTHPYFEPLCGAVVLLNAVLIGYCADYETQHGAGTLPAAVEGFDLAFFLVFLTELIFRILSRGPYDFYFGETMWWAWFDTFMVTNQSIDQFSKLIEPSNGLRNMSTLRLLRLPKLLRIGRALRMLRLFEVLQVVVNSIYASVQPAFWALVLLLMLVYVFSVFFLQIIGDSSNQSDELEEYFSSMGGTILVLFDALIGGVEWQAIVKLLISDVSPVMGVVFIVYITLGLFVVMNMVMSVFLDKVTRTVREDKDESVKERITQIFAPDSASDADELEINWEHFAAKLRQPVLQEYFRSIDIEVTEADARGVFDLLDFDGGGFLSANEIVTGCLRLRGPARALEMSLVLRELGALKDVEDNVKRLLTTVASVGSSLQAMQNHIQTALPIDEEAEVQLVADAEEPSSV